MKAFLSSLRRAVHSPHFDTIAILLAIVIVVGSVYAYSENWPPMVVVESNSMQHGSDDVLGVINTGDIVLVKAVNVPSGVNTYVGSETSGYSTYGELGDVIVYHPNGDSSSTPIIHRAILWLDWNAATGNYAAPSLFPLKCGPQGDYVTYPSGGSPSEAVCPTSPSTPLQPNLELFHVGWQSAVVTIKLDQLGALPGNQHSGYITMGDNNFAVAGAGNFDQNGCDISCIVEPSWVVGVARGMLPWLGILKLELTGQTACIQGPTGPEGGCIPQASQDYLAICIFIIVLLLTVVPWGIRRFRKRSRNRGRTKEPTKQEDVTALPP
jgi:signal peptidase